MNKNVPILGFIIGLILPFLGLLVVCFGWAHEKNFLHFLTSMMNSHDTASKVLILSILINLIPFVYYTSKRLDLTARGIFIATMLYALLDVLVFFNFFR